MNLNNRDKLTIARLLYTCILYEEGLLDAISHCNDPSNNEARKMAKDNIAKAKRYRKKLLQSRELKP